MFPRNRFRSAQLMILSRLATVLVCICLMTMALHGQVAGGRISGTVTDNTGAVVLGAEVTITSTGTLISRRLITNEAGVYSAPNLTPGNYSVSVSRPGFSTIVKSGLVVTVGSDLMANIALVIGQVQSTIEVQSDVAHVGTTNATLSSLVDGATVRQLPLNARDWTMLAALEPGVSTVAQTPVSNFLNRGNRGLGTQLAVAGARPQQNNYRIDGISINDYSNGAPGSALGTDLGVDAIEEFSVITGNAGADYGRSSGGIINAVTRHGTNDIHGSVYEFIRNSALDARNYFDPSKIPPFRRNQFGATFGGPIRRDRAFAFGDYEGLRQNLSVTQLAVVPSQNARNGQLVSGTITVDPKIAPYLALFPLPTSNVSGDTGTYTSIAPQISNQNFFTTRIDENLSAKDQLHGTYMFDDSTVTSPDLFLTIVQGTQTRRQLVTAEYVRILSSALISNLRAGFSRIADDSGKPVQTLIPLAGQITAGFTPGSPVGAINVTGIAGYTGGPGASGEVKYHFNSFQAYNDWFWNRGVHSLKFGAGLERIQDNELGTSVPDGVFGFSSLTNFLTNKPLSFSSALSGGNVSPEDIRQTIVGAYVQDDARIHSNLMLNVGLRYEIATVPTEVAGRQTNLLNLTDTQPHLGSPYFANPTWRNFEPRIGFSWDPLGKGRTAIRSAFGVYDVLPLTYEYNISAYLSAPFFNRGSISSGLPAGSFPNGAFSLLTPNQLRYSHVDPNPKRNYVMNWNLNIQSEITKTMVATIGYVGSRGVHQPFRGEDVNMVLPTATTTLGPMWPTPSGSGTKINPNVGQINGLFWGSESIYHGLQAQFTDSTKRGFQFSASYTFSKSIDTSSATVTGDAFVNSVLLLPWFDPSLRRGLSDYDVRHNLVISPMWKIPGLASSNRELGWLAGGWQVGAIYQFRSGLPFTPLVGGDPLGLKSLQTFDFPDRISGSGCGSAVNSGSILHYINTGCFAFPNPGTRLGTARRNSLIGPELSNLDLSVFKNNSIKRISESFNIQFRAEFFNILNRANFLPPVTNNTLFGPTGSAIGTAGLITATSTSSRQQQFALKVIW